MEQVDPAQRAVKDPRALPVLRSEQGEADEQARKHDRVGDISEESQVGGAVGTSLDVAQNVEVLPRQVLETRAEKAQLERLTHVKKTAHKLHAFGRAKPQAEPLEHRLLVELPGSMRRSAVRLVVQRRVKRDEAALAVVVFPSLAFGRVAVSLRRWQPHLQHYQLPLSGHR